MIGAPSAVYGVRCEVEPRNIRNYMAFGQGHERRIDANLMGAQNWLGLTNLTQLTYPHARG